MLLGAFGMAATEGRLGLAITTDAVRRGPAELAQSTLTLAGSNDGKTVVMIGAGELKQCKPYGYKRSEGLSRLEDHLRLLQLLYSAEDLIDFDGNHWHYKGAWIGAGHPYKPQVWAMGGGPRLMEMATRYADGISASAPCAFRTPEDVEAVVKEVSSMVEAADRDPDVFDFSLWIPTFLHEDAAVIEAALDHPLLKIWAAVFGRFHHGDWAKEGIDLILDESFHYAMKAIPTQWTRAYVDEIIAKVTPEMVRRSVFMGSPAEVAKLIGEYVDAGTTHVAVWDFGPMVGALAQAPQALGRSLELCGLLKARQAQ
jgi:phthiodiolone/phenolphthiodiolone dimycocerosates ketoreductase